MIYKYFYKCFHIYFSYDGRVLNLIYDRGTSLRGTKIQESQNNGRTGTLKKEK